jgi:acetyl esterase/lipase
MTDQIAQQLRQIGDEFTLATIQRTQQLFAPLARRPEDAGAQVTRDLTYGGDARQRLDIFRGEGAGACPVVVFVHGGGFAAGDKGAADAPFYNNVGAWAVQSGFVGVNVTYRLAPAHAWPSGAEDVAAALGWLHDNVARFGGDPRRIVLIGQSAGGAHVSGLLAGHAGDAPMPAAAILLSGIYEPDPFDVNPMQQVYYGAERGAYPARSAVLGLAATPVPCLFTISEFDPPTFHRQLAAVIAARVAMRGHCPETFYVTGHNHVSTSLQLGMAEDNLGPALAAYVRRHCG